jgi:hypothetical protein
MKNTPSNVALATTRHFTTADIACEIRANKRIQTKLPIRIAFARCCSQNRRNGC